MELDERPLQEKLGIPEDRAAMISQRAAKVVARIAAGDDEEAERTYEQAGILVSLIKAQLDKASK